MQNAAQPISFYKEVFSLKVKFAAVLQKVNYWTFCFKDVFVKLQIINNLLSILLKAFVIGWNDFNFYFL